MLASEVRRKHTQRSNESLSWSRMTVWQSTTVPVRMLFLEKKDQRSFHLGALLRVDSEPWRTGPTLTTLSIRCAVMGSFNNWLLNYSEVGEFVAFLVFGLRTWVFGLWSLAFGCAIEA